MTITEILLPTWKTTEETAAAWPEIQTAMAKAFSAFEGLQFSYGGNIIAEGQSSSEGLTARTVNVLIWDKKESFGAAVQGAAFKELLPKIGPHMEVKTTPILFHPEAGEVKTALQAPFTQVVKAATEGPGDDVLPSIVDVIKQAGVNLARIYRATADAQDGFLLLVGWDSVEEYKQHNFDAQFERIQQESPKGSQIMNAIAKMSMITEV